MMPTPVESALQIAMNALAMPEWNQDEMICALTNIARLLAAEQAVQELSGIQRPLCTCANTGYRNGKPCTECGRAAAQLVKEIVGVGHPVYEESDQVGNQFAGWNAKMPKKSQWLSICAKAARIFDSYKSENEDRCCAWIDAATKCNMPQDHPVHLDHQFRPTPKQ